MSFEIPEMTEEFGMPELKYVSKRGKGVKSQPYTFKYSNRMVATGKDYYNSLGMLSGKYKMSYSSEELALQLMVEEQGIIPRLSPIFEDIFGSCKRMELPVRQWTATALRIPDGQEPEQFDVFDNRRYWTRIVLLDNEENGEVLVPEGFGSIVTEWNEVFGIPSETKLFPDQHKPYTTHFWFSPKHYKDPISGHFDVAICRRNYYHDSNGCIEVYAVSERATEGLNDPYLICVEGFRPVIRDTAFRTDTIDERMSN